MTSGTTHDVTQEFLWYDGFNGDNQTPENRSSGAYIFRPKGVTAYPISSSNTPEVVIYSGFYQITFNQWLNFIWRLTGQLGPLVQEIHQTYDTWVNQIIRIYNGQDHVEFDWVVGPIDIE